MSNEPTYFTHRYQGATLRATSLSSDFRCSDFGIEEVLSMLRDDRPIWLDVHFSDAEAVRPLLRERLGLHELAVEDAVSPMERPASREFDDSLLVIVPAHILDSRDPAEVAFLLRENSLITICDQEVTVLRDWMMRTHRREGRRPVLAAMLLYSIVDSIVDSYYPYVDGFEDKVDDLADAIFLGDTGKLNDLLRLKREALGFRHTLGPLRDVLNVLLRSDQDLIPDSVRPYLQDVYDHTLRLLETLDISRETLASVLDVHVSMVSNNLNVVVKKMTVVSTVLMSMALVAGIYGMNFERMPELGWVYGYPFALGLMAASALLVLFAFKRAKWL